MLPRRAQRRRPSLPPILNRIRILPRRGPNRGRTVATVAGLTGETRVIHQRKVVAKSIVRVKVAPARVDPMRAGRARKGAMARVATKEADRGGVERVAVVAAPTLDPSAVRARNVPPRTRLTITRAGNR